LFSLIKSRRGPSFIFGFAPGFEQVDDLDINAIRKREITFDEEDSALIKSLEFIPLNSEPIPEQIIPEDRTIMQQAVEVIEAAPEKEEKEQVNTNHTAENSPTVIASGLGYEVSRVTETYNGEPYDMLCFTKQQEFDTFTAIFEYKVNQAADTWTFKAGRVDSTKRVEFSNGIGEESLKRHLALPVKFNPRTAIKYF
jgi:hypothetical protein